MKCPKCGSIEDIKFFVRHQKTSEDDESTVANAITILHANPECGFNETYMLEDCIELIFKDWSDLYQIEEKISELENSANGMNALFTGLMDNVNPEVIETEGEVVDDCEECALPDPMDEEE